MRNNGDTGPQLRRAVKGALIWAHHFPENGRWPGCVLLPLPGGRQVPICSRCLGIYPVTLIFLLGALAGIFDLGWLEPYGVWCLPIPALVEAATDWMGLRRGRHSLRIATGLLLGVALARLLERYLLNPDDPLFWSVVPLYSGIGVFLAILGGIRRTRSRKSH